MNKKLASILAVLIIVIFIGYIIFDIASPESNSKSVKSVESTETDQDNWVISKVFDPEIGSLKTVTVSSSGNIFLGGDSRVACFDKDLKPVWNLKSAKPVTALSISGDTIFASTIETILIISSAGELKDEWGPFEDKAIITSVASNSSLVTFADAGNKMVVVLTRNGEVKTMIGKTGEPFIIPSPYFDAALAEDNTLYIANPGNRRIETRDTEGSLIRFFGLPGTAPDAFCGCCNPAHFAVIPVGFVTAEKGINRIKILDEKGRFIEFVSSVNKFLPSIPLDVASFDGKTIYAANPFDGKLYVFNRKSKIE
jgi:DNA-binding beta-propeller fold protein YncE